MQLARRLYLYFIAAVSLFALALGLTNLLDLLIETIRDAIQGTDVVTGDADAIRRQLSIYAAIAIVALPIWLLHWWLAERGLDGGDGEEERRSAVRALYLSAVLSGSLIAGIVAVIRLVQLATLWIVGADTRLWSGDTEQWIALLVVAGCIWAYHGWVRLRDLRGGPVDEEADWLPRLYVYGAAFTGVTLLTFAVGDLLALVVEIMTTDDNVIIGAGRWDGLLASGVSRALVGTAVWSAHWLYSMRLADAPDWRGEHARASALRRFYGYSVAFGAVLLTLLLVTRVGEALLTELFNATPRDAEPFARRLLDPAVRALPFVVAWIYYRRQVLEESARFAEGNRQATVRRVYVYAIALIGLGLTGYGLASLIAVAVDRVTVTGDLVSAFGRDPWRAEVASLASLTLVGASAWLWHWAHAQDWLKADPATERTATVRRVYLFAVIAGSIVAVLVSLAIVMYRVFAELLGVEGSVALVQELGEPLAVLLVAAGLLAYHAILLRADLGERGASISEPGTTLQLVISAPAGANTDAIVATIKSHLPTGYAVRSVSRLD